MTVNITAEQVRILRERTGAGMMECKRALVETEGDMDKAAEELRKKGAAKADKKSGRIAAEGAVYIHDAGNQAVMIEVNSETDFVARDGNFTAFVKSAAETAFKTQQTDVANFVQQPMAGSEQTVEQARQELITKVGENVQVRRIVASNASAATVGCYLHGSRIGVLVELDSDQKELARDIAMHIAASHPIVINPEQVSAELIAKEKEIFSAQAATSGKPQEIIEKMVVGRLKKYLDEVSLTGQPFVKDPNVTVGSLLAKNRTKVLNFYRFEVGEGIEKVVEDFKEAVMSQVQGN